MNKRFKIQLLIIACVWVVSIVLAILVMQYYDFTALMIIAFSQPIIFLAVMNIPNTFVPIDGNVVGRCKYSKHRFITTCITSLLCIISVTAYILDITSNDTKYLREQYAKLAYRTYEYMDMDMLVKSSEHMQLVPGSYLLSLDTGLSLIVFASDLANSLGEYKKTGTVTQVEPILDEYSGDSTAVLSLINVYRSRTDEIVQDCVVGVDDSVNNAMDSISTASDVCTTYTIVMSAVLGIIFLFIDSTIMFVLRIGYLLFRKESLIKEV